MSNRNRNLAGLAFGVIAGAAAGYYLASEDGKKLRQDVSNNFRKMETDLKNTIQNQSQTISNKFGEFTESAKSFVNDTASTVQNKISSYQNSAEDVVEEAESDFQRGINRANNKLNQKADKIAMAAKS